MRMFPAEVINRKGGSRAGEQRPRVIIEQARTMGTKPVTSAIPRPPERATGRPDSERWRLTGRRVILAGVALALAAVGAYFIIGQSIARRAARQVRAAVAARRFDEAQAPLRHWLEVSPRSTEAYYYLARLKLAADQPQEALDAINRARALGYDRAPLDCLVAIIQSRGGRYTEAGPILQEAFSQGR